MGLDEFVCWYQKKIGTYDKQQWEKTVEQRILNGFVNVPLKNAKLKNDFIDVDLVRGSSFPKAKPKQSLIKVLQLALLRLFALPLYAKWWIAHTSPKVFSVLFIVYLVQLINWCIYCIIIYITDEDSDDSANAHVSELLVPCVISLILSIIHSQIVATASHNGKTQKRKPHYTINKTKKRERIKRKRKNIRIRSIPTETKPSNLPIDKGKSFTPAMQLTPTPNYAIPISSTSSTPITEILDSFIITTQTDNSFSSNCLRKRNVNWDSPIKSQLDFNEISIIPPPKDDVTKMVIDFYNDLIDKTEQIHCDLQASPPILNNPNNGGDDDGFESLNGKSSSGEENLLINNIINIVHENDQLASKLSDSDTDTLKCTNSTIRSRRNSLSLPLTSLHVKKSKSLSSSESDSRDKKTIKPVKSNIGLRTKKELTDSDTDQEDDDCETVSTPGIGTGPTHFKEVTTSGTEWIGITTNSEECSYSSEIHTDSHNEDSENCAEYDFTPTVILNPSCGANDRISCTIWDRCEIKKAEMSVLDISSSIIEKVEAMPETCDYIYIGVTFSLLLSLIPAFCRLCEATIDATNSTEINFFDVPVLLLEKTSLSWSLIMMVSFGNSICNRVIMISSLLLRISLTFLFFFLLAVAERTFKQRFLYAKLFSHLTSSRRSRKSEVPHFRLNKVRNIKTWLSVRSYLKRRGPQRSVDVIVSAAFMLTLLLLAFLSVEWLKDSVHLHSQFNLEALLWSCALGIFLLRFMTLGTKINRKYRSISVLITEQINLYLQIEQKPHKKEELMVSNSVLKLAADLLKELESPFKISGLSANPYLYTTVKVVILSALSGVLSEMLGFKLKLHKIKIK